MNDTANFKIINMFQKMLDDIQDFDSIPDFDRLSEIYSSQYYSSLVTSEYRNSPKFNAFLQILLTPFLDSSMFTNILSKYFDLDLAIGSQLDEIGVIVGQSREVDFTFTDGSSSTLSDMDYRIILKCKIIENFWDGTLPDLYSRWEALFPYGHIVIKDNQDMSFDVLIIGDFNFRFTELINHGYIVPRSCGVLNNNLGVGSTNWPVFGFDMETDFVKGFDEGNWSITQQ